MRLIEVVTVLGLKILCVDNVMLPYNEPDSDATLQQEDSDEANHYEHPPEVMGLRDLQKTTARNDDYEEERDLNSPLVKKHDQENTKPCSMMVVSNSQNSAAQSLLRKYRYDAYGVLIPNSVKYYMKIPQSFGSPPILVPLTGNAFSPLGGFVRYYKEVPPIPPTL